MTPGDGSAEVPGVRDLHPIGEGGHGVVLRGQLEQSDRTVAVKILRTCLQDEDDVRRFHDEVTRWARLTRTLAVLPLLDVGILRDGRPYLVLEHCRAVPLATRVARSGPLPVHEVLAIAATAAQTLRVVHDSGEVHGGITPANLLIRDDGRPALADFVLSLYHRITRPPAAETYSATFTAPEVFRARMYGLDTYGAAADRYALGATLYLLLTGRIPFVLPAGGGDLERLLHLARTPPPRRPRHVPPQLAELVVSLLAPEPGSRPDDVTLVRSLGRLELVPEAVPGRRAVDRSLLEPGAVTDRSIVNDANGTSDLAGTSGTGDTRMPGQRGTSDARTPGERGTSGTRTPSESGTSGTGHPPRLSVEPIGSGRRSGAREQTTRPRAPLGGLRPLATHASSPRALSAGAISRRTSLTVLGAVIVSAAAGVGYLFTATGHASDHDGQTVVRLRHLTATTAPIDPTGSGTPETPAASVAGPDIVLARPTLHGHTATLRWTGPRGMTYQVLLRDGTLHTPQRSLEIGAATRYSVRIDPAHGYCVAVEGTYPTRGGTTLTFTFSRSWALGARVRCAGL